MEIALIVVAVAFVVFTGTNDGGALLATMLRASAVQPLTAAMVLTGTVIVAPIVFGTHVATTLAGRLVTFSGQHSELALLLALGAAASVVALLARGGLPTSLTLALVGGILGVGIGGGLPVAWSWVVVVLLLAAAAPLAGSIVAYRLARLWCLLPACGPISRRARRANRFGLVLVAFAYGANDAQKMLAVFVLAMPGVAGTAQDPTIPILLIVGALFAIGMALGVRRYGTRLNSAVRSLTPIHTVSAQLAATLAVTGTAAVGAPVSMTQSASAALVGSGLIDGTTGIRWQQVATIATAWILTLPIAMLAAAVPAALLLRT
jgi:PiT family inorganic phosphate transporter